MNTTTLFGLCGAALVGLGLYGLVTNPEPLRKILAFNLLGDWMRDRLDPRLHGAT